jgi:FHS family L-fucose permease-like MFS transporter
MEINYKEVAIKDETAIPQNRKVSFIVLVGLFFIWGFIISMNDILIPYLKEVFELTFFQSMLVQFSFFGSFFIGSLFYFIISVRYGDPISKVGYRNSMSLGLFIAGLGCIGFYPATVFHIYGFFLGALFCLGFGICLLQIAANPYAALLGKQETASSRLNLAQGVNSLGTIIGPLLGGFLIFEYFFHPESTDASAVKIPYILFAAVFILLSIVVRFTPFPEFHKKDSPEKGLGVFRYPQLTLGVTALFLAVGAEVTIGSLLINFFGMENIAGLAPAEASKYVAFYWGGLMIGRLSGAVSFSEMSFHRKINIILIIVLAALGVVYYAYGYKVMGIYALFVLLNLIAFWFGKSLPGKTVGIFSLNMIVLILVASLTEGQTAMWCVIGVGLFASIMWSNIFTLGIRDLGNFTSQGSSLLIMAILGAALIPPLQGLIADYFGIQHSFFMIVFCHLFVAWYGFKGHKYVKENS